MPASNRALDLRRCLLGVFAKEPQPGEVKTRLAHDCGAAWAARFAEACLADLLDRLASLPCCRLVVHAPAASTHYFANLTKGRYDLCTQVDGTLGQRLEAFLSPQLEAGNGVVILGMDSPTVPLEFVRQAFVELERCDVVLGPALDGGYYLLGCRGRVPPIFDGIAWGSSEVLAQTIARLPQADWTYRLLPPWYDIDTPDDLQKLTEHLATMRRHGIDPEVPRVEMILKELGRCS